MSSFWTAEASEEPPPRVKHYHFYDLADADVFRSLGSMEGELPLPAADAGPKWPGLLAAAGLTLLAWFLTQLPFPPFTNADCRHSLGFSILAMLTGMLTASVITLPSSWLPGLRWTANALIPVAIVCLGALIDTRILSQISPLMWAGIPVLMAVAFVATFGLGRLFGLSTKLAALLGVGTAVCGSSAILALAPIIMARKEDMALSVGAINLVGVIALLLSLVVLQILPFDSTQFGYWTGASIQAVPQAIAIAKSHGTEAAAVATSAKLLRVFFLAPIVVLAGLWLARKQPTAGRKTRLGWITNIPWFVWGFAVMIALRSLGLLPVLQFESGPTSVDSVALFAVVSKWLLAIALAAIGLQISFQKLLQQNSGAARVITTTLGGWLVLSGATLLIVVLVR